MLPTRKKWYLLASPEADVTGNFTRPRARDFGGHKADAKATPDVQSNRRRDKGCGVLETEKLSSHEELGSFVISFT